MSLDYVGRKSCGCLVAWTSAENPADDLAKDLAGWIRRGLSVERMETEAARANLRGCKCGEQLEMTPTARNRREDEK